jgi:hypothetical protein
MLRRRALTGIAALLMGASLVFTGSTSAHNIDLAKARELARTYAQSVRGESGGKYLHYKTKCARNFPGHNHSVRCVIEYQNASDAAKGVYTCKESIELAFPPHDRSSNQMTYEIYANHASNNQCGSRRLAPWTSESRLKW